MKPNKILKLIGKLLITAGIWFFSLLVTLVVFGSMGLPDTVYTLLVLVVPVALSVAYWMLVARKDQDISAVQGDLNTLRAELADQQALYDSIVARAEADAVAKATEKIKAENEALIQQTEELSKLIQLENATLEFAQREQEKAKKAAATLMRKVESGRELLRSIDHVLTLYSSHELGDLREVQALLSECEALLSPTVTLELQCLSMKDLRKRYKQNEKRIEETLAKYESRYTTKTNAALYKLMVIALKAELQNVLFQIRHGGLDEALDSISVITQKYYSIVADGNQSIAPTLKKFIGEIDYYFQEAVRIEHEYYVQKERAKEEQRAIREQMRQEAEDRRALEAEKKKIEKEENKYHGQIAQLQEQLQTTTESDKVAQLEARLAELSLQLQAVKDKKEEITSLQNGKAGNVYVISNLGSFGDNVFKIGMTRRSEPQQRVDELGDASVPFPFDVHSFIFSDDAVALETKIHKILNDRRVNKVNLRKEFFHISLDELESLVSELAPTAEFKRTMLAEQYRQSLSIENIVDVVHNEDEDEE